MPTIFITGGAGFIGSNFIRYWANTYPEDRIINYDLLTYAGNQESLSDIEERLAGTGRYVFVQGDISNYHLTRHLFEMYRPDWVVNFAAETHNSRAIMEPDAFFTTNVLGTQQLLQAVLDANISRFHHISTCEVYGDLPLESNERFTEESAYRPRTPYNASKAGADMAVRAYYETFHLPTTISNCANNYGPYQFPEKLIPHFIIRLIKGQKMPLYHSSHHRREWLHVLDHCRAIDLILREGKPGDTYNIGSGMELDVEQIATLLLEEFNLDISYKTYVPDRPGHDRRYLLDSNKIRRELGWEPQVNFTQGFHDTVNWYRNNHSWWEPLLKRLQVNEEGWR